MTREKDTAKRSQNTDHSRRTLQDNHPREKDPRRTFGRERTIEIVQLTEDHRSGTSHDDAGAVSDVNVTSVAVNRHLLCSVAVLRQM